MTYKQKAVEEKILKIRKAIKRFKDLYYAPENRRSNGKQTAEGMELYYYPMLNLKLQLCELENHPKVHSDGSCQCAGTSQETKNYYEENYPIKL